MQEYQLGEMARVRWSMTPVAIFGSLGLWLVVVALMTAVFSIPIGSALIGGIVVVILHWFSEIVHQLGHAWAARRTGYPMTGGRAGKFGVFITSLYPPDEPPLPATIHLRRAVGGPIFSAWLTSIAFIILLMVMQAASELWLFILWFFFLENLIVMTLQVFIPLGFNDGATIWHWLRKR